MSRWGLWLFGVAASALLDLAFPCREAWSPIAAAVAVGLPLAVAVRLVPRPRSRGGRLAGLLAVGAVSAVAGALTLISHVCF